jgi:integrase/recombinase XerD
MSKAAQFATLGELLESFFDARLVLQQNVSTNTVDSYRDTWKLLLRYIADTTGFSMSKISVEMITAKTVLGFLDHLESGRNCGISTRNQRRAAIRAFAKHAILTEPKYMGQFERMLAIPSKKTEKKVLGYLTKKEMDAVLYSFDRRTVSGRRGYALFLFMYNSGARVSEVVAVRCEDVRQSQALIHGKGSKERVIPLWADTVKVLWDLADEENRSATPAEQLFRNSKGVPITRSGITYLLEKAVCQASKTCESLIDRNISPHTIRHTTAMHLLQSGVDINLIRMWLGHVNLDTTHGYIEADVEMKRVALEKGGITPGNTSYTWKAVDEIKAFLDSLGVK